MKAVQVTLPTLLPTPGPTSHNSDAPDEEAPTCPLSRPVTNEEVRFGTSPRITQRGHDDSASFHQSLSGAPLGQISPAHHGCKDRTQLSNETCMKDSRCDQETSKSQDLEATPTPERGVNSDDDARSSDHLTGHIAATSAPRQSNTRRQPFRKRNHNFGCSNAFKRAVLKQKMQRQTMFKSLRRGALNARGKREVHEMSADLRAKLDMIKRTVPLPAFGDCNTATQPCSVDDGNVASGQTLRTHAIPTSDRRHRVLKKKSRCASRGS